LGPLSTDSTGRTSACVGFQLRCGTFQLPCSLSAAPWRCQYGRRPPHLNRYKPAGRAPGGSGWLRKARQGWPTGIAATSRTSYHPVMKTSGITAALPAQDVGRAKAFYVDKVGLQALESDFLKARDGQVGLRVGDDVGRLFVYPARVRSSGEFTQAVIHVADVRAAVEEMRSRGVVFEEYDTPETRTENGVARMPGGGEAAWFKDSEGNLVGVVPA
jgi:predicted enzyme related to lactoylglutathione lyase